MKFKKTFSLYFATVVLITTMLAGAVLLYISGADWYYVLFQNRIFLIPSGIFILLTSLLFGIVTGWIIGTIYDEKNKAIHTALLEIERGNYQSDFMQAKFSDELIWLTIAGISNRFQELAQTQQKLASERSEWNSQLKEEVLTKERNRLARELHDSVSQQLFAATMLLSAINQNPDPTSDTAIKQRRLVEGIVNEAQSEMRALLLHLRPIQLEGKSLKNGMEEILSELTSKLPMEVIWNIQDIKLEKGVEDHLFRIVQEAVSNTLRHAKANLLEVALKQINNVVFLKITDNGKGFDIKKTKTGSYGLRNIKERASEIGGSVKIISLIGKGTSIEVKVPILLQKGEGND